MKNMEILRPTKQLTVEGRAVCTLAHIADGAPVALLSARQEPSVSRHKVLVVATAAARRLRGCLQPRPALVFNNLGHADSEVTGLALPMPLSFACT